MTSHCSGCCWCCCAAFRASQGWKLSGDAALQRTWAFPDSATLPAGAYIVVYAAGGAANGSTSQLQADFKVSKSGKEPVTLLRPDGSTASSMGAPLPR